MNGIEENVIRVQSHFLSMQPIGSQSRFENYPARLVATANLFAFAPYALGALVFLSFGWPFVVLFLAFCAFLEFRVLSVSCRRCYYFGKTCFSGKGRVAAKFFERSPDSLASKKITKLAVLPDFMVTLLPAFGGIYLLLVRFDWIIVGAVVGLLLLATVGNSYVRGSIACKHCKQRDLGCPALSLFEGKPPAKGEMSKE